MRPIHGKRVPNWGIGLVAIALTVAGFYLAFAKSIPFSGDGYTLRAVFADAQNIRVASPVRVAGVEVGKVTSVDHLTDTGGRGQGAAVVTIRVDDEGRPVHEDVSLALRPRLFLEGNLFVDMQPGSPGSEELDSGSVIPLERTQVSVQLDQVLTTLQRPVRDNLQLFLKEFGSALDDHGGAEGFRELFRTSPAAYRSTAQVNEALLGTEPGDLAGVVRNFGNVAEALSRDRDKLQGFVTNLRRVSGAFAAEDRSLEQAIAELPRALEVGRPALAKLNDSFPALRAFAREALPGTRAANRALDDAGPWIRQMRLLVSRPELRGLVRDLRPTIPRLARLARTTVPFLEESRALSSCFNEVVIPWSNDTPPAESDPGQAAPVYKGTGYGLVGVAGESRSGDAQGQWFRVLGGGGPNTVSFPNTDTGLTAGVTPFPILGVQPAKQSAAKTPFRPDVPCETQEKPDLRTGPTDDALPEMTTASERSSSPALEEVQRLSQEYAAIYTKLLEVEALKLGGGDSAAAELERQVSAQMKKFFDLKLPLYKQAVAELTGGGG